MDTGIETYTPDWFKMRQGRFTASAAWKLMAHPRTKKERESGELSATTLTYVLEKVWESLSDQTAVNIDNAATAWGVEQEEHAAKWYSKLTGNELNECGLYEVKGLNILATPDRITNDNKLVEIKCPYNGGNMILCFLA